VVEARQDTLVVIHPVTDDRRILPIEKTGELLTAASGFQLVVSYNPGYQHALKDLKPSTRQRFVAIEFDFPSPAREMEIVMHESGVPRATARALTELAVQIRRLRDQGLAEGPGTRLLVRSARLIASGIAPREACRTALAAPLTDDPDLLAAIGDLVEQTI
jgi:nitric oxide reductase NorQ protein